MEKEPINTAMETNIKESGETIVKMVMESTTTTALQRSTMDNGLMGKNTDMERIHMLMVIFMKGTGKMERKMEKAHFSMLRVLFMKGNGLMIKQMVKEY